MIIVVINGAQSGDQLHEVGAIGRFLKQPCISDFKKKKNFFFFVVSAIVEWTSSYSVTASYWYAALAFGNKLGAIGLLIVCVIFR